MWTSNQLEINPEPYYFEYNEPGEVDAHGPWTYTRLIPLIRTIIVLRNRTLLAKTGC